MLPCHGVLVVLLAAGGCASSSPTRASAAAAPPPSAPGAGAPRDHSARLPRAFIGGISAASTSLGPARAKVRIDWFSDFECLYCARAHTMMVRLARQFPSELHIRHRDFPLDMRCNPAISRPFHRRACAAAIHARCAAAQGKFWPYSALLTKRSRALDDATLSAHAQALRLDMARFRSCLGSEAAKSAVKADIDLGLRWGVKGTPSYYIDGKRSQLHTLSAWSRAVRKLLGKTP